VTRREVSPRGGARHPKNAAPAKAILRAGLRPAGEASSRRPAAGPRIVVLGGGSGLASLLGGLKRWTDRLTAVVTVTDEGGSSGRLRRAFQVLPPGDLRNCLVALAQDGTLLSRLFQYRFPRANGNRDELSGHAFGNLFITALTSVAGGFDAAIAAAGQILAVRGRVLPATLEPVRLSARLADGRRVVGETRVSKSRTRIRRVQLVPSSPEPAPGVLEAIAAADLVVLGPGSLFTSVIPPLLVKGVVEALSRSKARRVYICNLMTQPGETDGFTAIDHLQAVLSHMTPRAGGKTCLDAMLVNQAAFQETMLKRYAGAGSFPVPPPAESSWRGVRVVRSALRPLVPAADGRGFRREVRRGESAPKARHSPELLAKSISDHFLRKRP
jgi:uncharacterized cofD-like protein